MRLPTLVRPPLARILLGALLIALLASMLADGVVLRAGPEAVSLISSTLATSGGVHYSPHYQLAGTSGQITGPPGPILSSPNYRLRSGFWGVTEFSPGPHFFDKLLYLPVVRRR